MGKTAADSGGVGHNSGSIAADQLRALIERIERLEEEKQTIAADIREVYAEAKANGFDTKTMRQVVKLRRMDAAERQEQQEILDLYLSALGMLADTPLGEAAVRREFGETASKGGDSGDEGDADPSAGAGAQGDGADDAVTSGAAPDPAGIPDFMQAEGAADAGAER